MRIDKEMYRNAYAQYQQWNAAETVERVRNAGQLSPTQGWQQYIELVEFCWKLNPQQSEWQRAQKIVALEQYYERVQQLETWRKARGKAT